MQQARIHPLLAATSAAVLILSAVAVAAITGVLPGAVSKPGDAARVAQAARCPNCGVIESIRVVETPGDASGLGAVAGGLTGAVVGSQFGSGTGRTVMTIAGAAGGAYAGNQIEKQVKKRASYRVAVRLEDGSVRTLTQAEQPPFAVGDRVRVNGNSLGRA